MGEPIHGRVVVLQHYACDGYQACQSIEAIADYGIESPLNGACTSERADADAQGDSETWIVQV